MDWTPLPRKVDGMSEEVAVKIPRAKLSEILNELTEATVRIGESIDELKRLEQNE